MAVEPQARLLTPADIAALAQVSVKTVYRAIRSGTLSAIAIGGRYRVTSEAYGDWIARQTVTPRNVTVQPHPITTPLRGSLEALRRIETA